MPQRDDLIEEIKRTDLLLEWAVQHGDEAEAERLREMLRAIREEVDALYIEGTRYRKTGIVFFGLEKPGTAHQTDLFDDTPPAEKSRLYAAVDALNARYGKGKVFSARLSLRSACSLPHGSRTPARGGYARRFKSAARFRGEMRNVRAC